eukprot:CAMPEP_0170501872 /NCGR_PEP_ID=MMETSP0208-20121228/39712_1 /TAXON_ID=197538 /ORGANISM="Strombidium inclinatum, Strain S3" /LENGTH=107 /DNA_ID=CAMNT_0010780625 /DNA_START=133 /DNA_END=456 /DNA_ORIENTATION=+
MIKRTEIRDTEPSLTQKAIQTRVKREWKKLADKRPYFEASQKDYSHFKFLNGLWERGLLLKDKTAKNEMMCPESARLMGLQLSNGYLSTASCAVQPSFPKAERAKLA